MDNWTGVITIGEIEAHVKVLIDIPEEGLGTWFGTGTSNKHFMPDLYETEIGTILINDIRFSGNQVKFSFRGSGNIKIELSELNK